MSSSTTTSYRLRGLCLVLSLIVLVVDLSTGLTLSETIKNHPKLTKFTEMINKQDTTGTLSWSLIDSAAQTCYAPIDEAWSMAPAIADDKIVLVLQNHFETNRAWTWAQMETTRFMNKTQTPAMGGYKQLLYHKEHGNYFVDGSMFVTEKHTNPVVNEITYDRGSLFLIDRVIASEGHTNNFYNHMKKDESKASEFAKLVDHFGTTGTDGKKFIQKLGIEKGTILIPEASALSSPLVQAELDFLKSDTAMLKEVLESHLVENNFIFTRYFHEEVTWTTVGKPFISHAADPVIHPGVDRLVEGGGVVAELKDVNANITMSNGVMHFIDAILHFKFTVYTIIGTNRGLDRMAPGASTAVATGGLFMKAIQKITSITNLLKSRTDTVTVFAPTHTATEQSEHFKSLIDQVSSTADQQQQDASELAKLLNKCIVKQKLTLADLKAGVNVTNVDGTALVSEVIGADLFVVVDGLRARIMENNADIQASNGVVHVIDRVLGIKGTNIWEKMTKTNFASQLTKFNKLVEATGLNTVLSDPNLQLSVFAPVDSAFEQTKRQFAKQQPNFDDFLSLDQYSAGRIVFVKRHIVVNKTKISVDSEKMMLHTMNKDEKIQVERLDVEMRVTYRSVGGQLLGPLPNLEADNGYLYRIKSGCLYSMEDPKIGQIGTGAASFGLSFFIAIFCAILAMWRL